MRRNPKGRSSDSKSYFLWLSYAYEDLLAAQTLIGQKTCYNQAAFHCQQCIEKALKAFILFHSRVHVDGHNLTWLCREAEKYDDSFSRWLGPSASLNRFYIETRYPSDIPLELSEEKITSVFQTAGDLYDFICDDIYDNDMPD